MGLRSVDRDLGQKFQNMRAFVISDNNIVIEEIRAVPGKTNNPPGVEYSSWLDREMAPLSQVPAQVPLGYVPHEGPPRSGAPLGREVAARLRLHVKVCSSECPGSGHHANEVSRWLATTRVGAGQRVLMLLLMPRFGGLLVPIAF